MSIPAISWCIEQKGLPPGEWVVLFHLCYHHDPKARALLPSAEYLAETTGMGLRTVRRNLTGLKRRGLLVRSSARAAYSLAHEASG